MLSLTVIVGLFLGLVAGLLAGVLGVGGGIIMVPGLVILLGTEQHVAQGVSLAVIVIVGLLGATTHYRQGNVRLNQVALLAPAAVACSLLGAFLAGFLPGPWLTRVYAVFLLFIGGHMIWSSHTAQQTH